MIKPALSIKYIGNLRFYLGITIGISTYILLYFLLNIFIQGVRFGSFPDRLFILSSSETYILNLILAGLAFIFSFNTCLSIWFSRLKIKRYNYRFTNILVLHNASFSSWILIGWFTKAGAVLWLFINMYFADYVFYNADVEMFPSYFGAVGILIIVLFFLQMWNNVLLHFKAIKWFVLNGIFFISTCLLLASFNFSYSEYMNEVFLKKNSWKMTYFKNEFKRAKELGVKLSVNDIGKMPFTEQRVAFANSLTNKKGKVSLKQLIIHKILLHNLSYSFDHYHGNPFYLLGLMKVSFNEENCKKIKALKEIVDIYKELLNMPTSWTKQELDQLTIDEKIRIEAMYDFNNEYPENWVMIDYRKVLGKEIPQNKNEDFIDLGSLDADIKDYNGMIALEKLKKDLEEFERNYKKHATTLSCILSDSDKL